MLSEIKLKVTVINGRGLSCKDSTKDVCPYCVLQTGSATYQTRALTNTSNPQWNEEFLFDVEPGSEVLSFSIWHRNTLKKDVVIGYAFVDFGNLKEDEKTTINIQLQGIYKGEVKLSIVPLYETTASKLVRLNRQISLLQYDVSNHVATNQGLKNKIEELKNLNESLAQKNQLLEEDKLLLMEYDILSPRTVFMTAKEHDLTSSTSHSIKQGDDFDIISENDVKNTLCNDHDHQSELVENDCKGSRKNDIRNEISIDKNKPMDKESLWGDLLFHETNMRGKLVNEFHKRLMSKVSSLEDENTELKHFIQQTSDRLKPVRREHEDSVNECQYCGGVIKGEIAHLRHLKYQNDTTITLLKQIISSFNDTAVEQYELEKEDKYEEVESDLDSGQYENGDEGEAEEENAMSLKTTNDPDILSIKEYFWDEYLPISTASSQEDVENWEKTEGNSQVIEGITDDIDDFIKNNYIFKNRYDAVEFTKSQMLEENEHFKEMNIRLIKENEEVHERMRLMQVQLHNLHNQLSDTAPSCMKDITGNLIENPLPSTEDKGYLYKKHTDKMAAQALACACKEVMKEVGKEEEVSSKFIV